MASHNASVSVPEMASGFHPTVWGDFFIDYSPQPSQKSEEWTAERMSQLKEKIAGLFGACTTTAEQLNLVDTLQHLSIDHHFSTQILSVLTSAHAAEELNSGGACLHDVALRFRLLRQQGFWVSPEVFDRFRDENGSFDVGVADDDARGLLSLYNAAYLLTHGEAELEEAALFARQRLESMSMRGSLEYPLAQQVSRALHLPLPRTVRRVETLHYVSEYGGDPTHEHEHDPSVLEFARLDFELLQRLHVKELKALSRWWKDLYNEAGVTYSRDRVVECYLWSYTAYYEEEHARARMILAKMIALIILTDDTYDVRATLEECRRWDESAVSLLPDYLKKFYLKLMNIFEEFEDELEPHEKCRVAFSRKAFQTLSSNYLQEAEWFHGRYKPRFEDQVKVSTVRSGAPFAAVGLLVGMGGDVATQEALEWAMGCTDAVKAFAEVTRFMNDLASYKRGKNKNDVDSSVECYISEHGVTAEVAFAQISSLIEDAWKTINGARFENSKLLPAVQRVADITASMPLMYGDNKDAFTFSDGLKGLIERLFLNRP
ncbi:Tau-cadinol synthase-like [Zea mays]|uniref:Uncharacterized protein n=1 Tax=Zea mays TaxID=4577 RepID=B4FWX9_MAIZE|nr:Tau-cadinol synthase-like [Zea mays]ACF86622.1 unknown [Zea mays]|eukprot:NP_001141562.1 uncharacterized protein LOC100273678 [Zea mays]